MQRVPMGAHSRIKVAYRNVVGSCSKRMSRVALLAAAQSSFEVVELAVRRVQWPS